MLKPQVSPPKHEEAFLQRYEQLRSWARRLVQNDQQQAEDLLHDVFLQFTISHPDLKSIENLDGYLNTMLRNLHLSQLRRASRIRDAAKPLVEYESASAGLEALRKETESQAWDELRGICEYALLRRETSKIASVLILRFFHGYYPVEIASILRINRAAVDRSLQTARTEAKAYLADRGSLVFINEKPKLSIISSEIEADAEGLLPHLCKVIFQSATGECLTREDLKALFLEVDAEPIDCKTLAHIVSCMRCLNGVNECLGLPLLSTRHPAEMLGRDKSPKGKTGGTGGPPSSGAGAGGGEMDNFLKRHREQVKELHEHRPQELLVSVNGFIVGAHTVTSEHNKQSLSVNLEERISFVEVFSERDVRLLFCSIEPPPDGPGEYRERVELSDGRALEMMLEFAESHPQVHVTYHDPAQHALSPELATDAHSRGSQSGTSMLGAQASSPPVDDLGLLVEGAGEDARAPSTLKFKSTLRWLTQFEVGSRFWFRPATATVLVALLAFAAVWLVSRSRGPEKVFTAAELLARANAAEQTLGAQPDQVLHRTVTLEERVLSEPGAVTTVSMNTKRHRIEIWQSAETGITARRLYDDKGYLLRGDWTRSDGVQTIYHHGLRTEVQRRDPQTAIGSLEVWQIDASAKDFAALIGDTARAQIEDRPSSYVINYQLANEVGSTVAGQPALVRASLVLSRSDLHITEMTLIISAADKLEWANQHSAIGNRQLTEYRFLETSIERRPPASVAPSVFEPEPELLGTATASPRLPVSTSPGLPVTASPVLATPELEVEVLRLLNQAGADMGEQVSVTRSNGRLQVAGVVETNERKAEILKALSSVAANPAVRVDVETAAEAAARIKRSQPSSSVELQRLEIASESIPVGPELRRYFHVEGEQDTEEVRRFAFRMINLSSQAVSHAGAMKRLVNQFSSEELHGLQQDARAKWLGLIGGHAVEFERDTATLRHELQPVFFPSAGNDVFGFELRIESDADLVRAVQTLFELAAANYERVRASFSVSSGSTSVAPVKSLQFWNSLIESEKAASRIRSAAQK